MLNMIRLFPLTAATICPDDDEALGNTVTAGSSFGAAEVIQAQPGFKQVQFDIVAEFHPFAISMLHVEVWGEIPILHSARFSIF